MTHLKKINSKIFSSREILNAKVQLWKEEGHKVAFTNGCFDILHKGHIAYLANGADLADKLILGLNSDSSVKRLNKSPNRPLQNEEGRAAVMAALEFIDAVILFEEDTPQELIKTLLPDVLFKGADYQVEDIVGAKEVLDNGGSIETISFIEGYSTTAIEQKILNQK